MATGTQVRSIGQVNSALKARKIDMELVKGKDYFYFVGDDVDLSADGTSVYVPRVSDLSLEQWIDEAIDKKVKAAS
jgi:hypothetical protein